MKTFLSFLLLMVTVSLNAQSGTFFPSNVFFLNLPTNASPVAFIAVDEAGKVYETATPAGGSGSGSLATNPLASAAVNTLFSAPTRLVFDGDSLTSSNFSHPFYTSNRLGVAGASIVVTNTAISGQTIPQMIARYTNFVQPNKPVTGTNAILFAWGGINDVYFATNGANTTIANLSNYWAIAKADGFTLVAFTISSRSDFPGLTNSSTVAFLNQWIRSQATWDYLVDVDQIFPTWLPTTHLLEGTAYIHFTTNSQRMISDMALATLFSPEHLNLPPNNMLTQFIGTNYFDQGSELGPSIAFNQERNMGFSRAATSLMGLSLGGVGEFMWGSTISRQSSDITLQWASGGGYSTSGDVGLSRLAANSLALGNGGNGNASGTLTLGNVGIGTTTPTNALDVTGNTSLRSNVWVTLNMAAGKLGATNLSVGAIPYVGSDGLLRDGAAIGATTIGFGIGTVGGGNMFIGSESGIGILQSGGDGSSRSGYVPGLVVTQDMSGITPSDLAIFALLNTGTPSSTTLSRWTSNGVTMAAIRMDGQLTVQSLVVSNSMTVPSLNVTTLVATNIVGLERSRQIANVEQLAKYLLPIPVGFSNNWKNFGGGYGTTRFVRDWTQTFLEGTVDNSGGNDVSANTLFFVPWGYRLSEGYPGGGIAYSSDEGLRNNSWIHADSRFNSSYNFTNIVTVQLSARWLSTAYYIAVQNPSDTNACLLLPPNLTNATTLVVFFHGMSGNQFDFVNSRDNAASADSNYIVTAKAFMTNGWPLLSHYGSGNSWGNATSLNEYSNSIVWATNALIVTNLVFLDGSMGGTLGLPLFGQFQSASRIYNISPITSLSNAYFSGNATFSNSINTAYATSAATFTADTASYDPYRLATNAYGGRRVRFSASAADTTVATNLHSYLWTNKFYSATITVTNSTGDHADAGQAISADIINYFR